MKKIIFVLAICTSVLAACARVEPTIGKSKGTEPEPEPEPDGTEEVKIDINTAFQTIESFSASDCWLPNYIGTYWDEPVKAEIAKLLFSGEIKNRKPDGIGLSGWRFNLGGGTANQGAASGIDDESRRAESFMDPSDGSLDWTKQAGQQYFLRKAKEYGMTEQFVMFSNTPPVYLTKNGLGYNKGNNPTWRANLKSDCYDDFAGYIAAALNHFKTSLGIEFSFVSPANEPQYNWTDSSQEGSPYANDEIATLVREIDRAITDAGLSTQILISEAASWKYLYSDEDTYRWNQISDFFSSSSTNYIGDLANVPNIIGGHSYGTDGNWNTMVETRRTVAQAAQAAGLRLYQTEWSMLGDGYSASEFVGYDNATEMDIALYMSKVIHCDLTYAGVSSWSYWTAVDLERWDHKNRFLLIKAVPSGGVYGDIKSSGTCQAAKTLWVLGNYSRFVRPGYSRIKIEMDKGSQKFFGNAFAAPDGNTVVAVYTNLSGEEYDVRAAIAGFNPSEIKTYTTNSDMDLEEGSVGGRNIPIKIKPNSVVTVVYKK